MINGKLNTVTLHVDGFKSSHVDGFKSSQVDKKVMMNSLNGYKTNTERINQLL
jgi:hypothetical protein